MFSLAFCTTLVCIFTSIIWGWWWYISEKGRFYKKIPGPPGLPILGNALEMASTKTILDVLIRYQQNYGDIVKVSIGPFRRIIVVTDYKLLEFILSSTKTLKKSPDYDFLRDWLGTGLATGTVTQWKKHRRIIAPAFHFKILEQFLETYERIGDILLKKFEENSSENVNILPLISLYTLDVICESAMGVSIDAQNNLHSEYTASVKEMCRILMERVTSLTQTNNFLFKFTKNYSKQKRAVHYLHQFTLNVIKQRQKEKQQRINQIHNDEEDEIGMKKKQYFLNLLLDSTIDGRPLTDEEIREEVDTLMFAGHDTTASALSFALYCLANHSDVQRRVYEEQKEIFDDLSAVIKYQDLSEMKYLEQVIKETLRLYSTAPIIFRETDQKLEFGDFIIPERVTFLIFIYGIHRDPKYFTNPHQFDPNRFDTFDNKLPYSFIPFSAGPRNCIGQKFAMLEMKHVLSKIIRKFELLPAIPEHKLQVASEIVLTSANGIKIGLRKRQ